MESSLASGPRGELPPAGSTWRPPAWGELVPDAPALSDHHWLALLLGPPPGAWLARARAALDRHDLRGLAGASARRLARELGLPPARAARVVAAFALARALQRERRPRRLALDSARAVHERCAPLVARLEHERFLALLLDGRHRLLRVVEVSQGTLTSSLVHPREVFAEAVREAAGALIVVHNHPSGDPEPSAEDLEVTRRLHAAGALLGIPLLDHVVVAEEGFVSLRERLGGLFRGGGG